MPAPMPPNGPSQPAGPGAPPQAQGAGAGGAISTLFVNVDKAIDHLNLVIGQSKATNPQEKALINQIDQLYGRLMDMLGIAGQEGDQADQSQAQGQTVPPEAAGNPGAIPAP